MPIGKTYRQVLDQPDAVELVLNIPSFAGGENTIGQNQELKSNEARLIENWDSDSFGGMVRSKGFTQIASGLNYIKTAVFTGSGLNDATSGGTYSGTVNATYTIILDSSAASPDTFKWKKDSGSYTTGVVMTGAAQTLSDGVTITFAATDGHTLNDQWVITAISYTTAPDGALHHFEGTSIRNYIIVEGDVAYINSNSITKTDIAAFTSGILTHGLSAGSKAWFTNATDNLKYTTIGGSITVPTTVPPNARNRIYLHKSRLVAEGGGVTVYGSKAGSGNWAGAGGWTTAGDAWSIDLPDLTQGCVPGFPNGGQITVFTKFGAYALTNMPNIAQNYIIGSHGCSQPYSIQIGAEGIYFFSLFPTLGVFLWDGANWTNLTVNEDWVSNVSLTNRCFGIYSENKYRLIYNDNTSGVSYPNVERIYDARWGRWMNRTINSSVADNFGIPFLLTKSSNELYVTSSRTDKVYQLEDTSDSDNTYSTIAIYKTKDFTSLDFGLPRDEVRMKLIKVTFNYYGSNGTFSLLWTSDEGVNSGSITVPVAVTSAGALLNTTFIVNISLIVSASSFTNKTVTRSFSNSAVGRKFNFELINSDTGVRVKIKKLKIVAIALEE